MDLFDLGAGSQVHDLQPGISPNDLFWVAEIPDDSFGSNASHAGLRLRNLPLVDTFTFFGPTNVSAGVDIDLVWNAIGPPHERGKGTDVDPKDPAAFSGQFSEANCYGYVRGHEIGFSFQTKRLDSSGYYAQLGRERNGSFLT